MIYTDLTKKAMKIMVQQHEGQKDRSGLPYAFHPWHVAESMDDEISTVVALLHDTIEDTSMTFDDLRAQGIPEEAIEALTLLTHDKNVEYLDYVKALAPNPIARKVKLSDLKHNSDLGRLDEVTDLDLKRNEKYSKAIEYLENYK